ncbi:MAG: redoxin domain-containing protein [Candidatus Tectomicrobia bacterium]|nr:redoxin domain-containing protein [Candidatus Tectomicrobia bacterium]
MALTVRVGDRFPDFELPSSSGEVARLSELLKKKPSIVAFYRGYW